MNGPAAFVASVPVGDEVVIVIASGACGRAATPATCGWIVIGVETAPATTVGGGVTKVSVVGDHVRNVAQLGVRAAPARSPPHQRFLPGGPQASTPGSEGESPPESRIAAASRSSTAPAAEANSFFGTLPGFRGAHAKPQRSSGRPNEASWLRIA